MKPISVLLFLAVSVVIPIVSSAQIERIDSTFAINGMTIVNAGSTEDVPIGMAVQSTGKILVSGNVSANNANTAFTVRFHPDGTLDTTFGYKGYVVPFDISRQMVYRTLLVTSDDKFFVAGYTYGEKGYTSYVAKYSANGQMEGLVRDTIPNAIIMATSIAVQADGKVVVGAIHSSSSQWDFAVFRYTSDFKRDLTFGNNGMALTDLPWSDNTPRAIAIQSDGKIVQVGHSAGQSFSRVTVVRYHDDGVIDQTFGTDGSTSFYTRGLNCSGAAVQLDPNGKIVIGGFAEYEPYRKCMAVVRLMPNGSFDNTFNDSGKVVVTIGTKTDEGTAIELQPDGSIMLVGTSAYDAQKLMSIVRLTSSGAFDATFSNDGKQLLSIGGQEDIGVAVDTDAEGRIIVAGNAMFQSKKDIAVVGLLSNGDTDTTFAHAGQIVWNFQAYGDSPKALLRRPLGGYVIAAAAQATGAADYAAVAFTSTGYLETGYGTGGVATGIVGYPANYCDAAVMQSDGGVVLAGRTHDQQSIPKSGISAIKFDKFGKLDISFGTGGTIYINDDEANFGTNALALQSDGKIVLVGYRQQGNNTEALVARFHANGRLDEQFATNGFSMLPSFGFGAIVPRSDGKLVLAGSTAFGGSRNMAAVLFDATGNRETNYGTSGRGFVEFGKNSSVTRAIEQPDGKLLMAGHVEGVGGQDIALARLHPTGIVDSSFGIDGRVVLPLDSQYEYCNGLVQRSSGRIIVVGHTARSGVTNCLLYFLKANGSLDPSYGINGKLIFDFPEPSEGMTGGLLVNDKLVVAGSIMMPKTGQDVFLTRIILGADLGVLEKDDRSHSFDVFPNPIRTGTSIEYSLTDPDRLTLSLIDMRGQQVLRFFEDAFRQSGSHMERLTLQSPLSKGAYWLVFSGSKTFKRVKVFIE